MLILTKFTISTCTLYISYSCIKVNRYFVFSSKYFLLFVLSICLHLFFT
nr:MAG TPA: hypothetical protein [Caudoviricetes sp.]